MLRDDFKENEDMDLSDIEDKRVSDDADLIEVGEADEEIFACEQCDKIKYVINCQVWRFTCWDITQE